MVLSLGELSVALGELGTDSVRLCKPPSASAVVPDAGFSVWRRKLVPASKDVCPKCDGGEVPGGDGDLLLSLCNEFGSTTGSAADC